MKNALGLQVHVFNDDQVFWVERYRSVFVIQSPCDVLVQWSSGSLNRPLLESSSAVVEKGLKCSVGALSLERTVLQATPPQPLSTLAPSSISFQDLEVLPYLSSPPSNIMAGMESLPAEIVFHIARCKYPALSRHLTEKCSSRTQGHCNSPACQQAFPRTRPR